jgi:hypothetical protein
LLWNFVRGWKAGPARMAVAFGAVAVGYIGALFFGDALVSPLRPLLGFPDLMLLAVGRALVGVLCYLLVVGIGAVLFKRTSQQGVGLLLLLYGLSGAALGLLFGAVVVWTLILAVRFTGAIAEGRSAPGAPAEAKADASDATGALANRVLNTTLSWKKDLESGPISPVVKAADPFVARDYEVMTKTGRVLARPEAMKRFLEAPAIKPLIRDPRFQALLADPEVVRLAKEQNYALLLRSSTVVEFLNDPATLAQIKALDFESVLNYALQETPASVRPPGQP